MASLRIEIFGPEKELSQKQKHLLTVEFMVAVNKTRIGGGSKKTRWFYFAVASSSHYEVYAKIGGARHCQTPEEYKELISVVGGELGKIFPGVGVHCNLDAHTAGVYEWPVANETE
ncbi:MAG: hypothetical protein AAB951_01075 [Patescibacteria group bacterium]